MRLGIRELIFLLVLVAVPVAAYLFVFQPRNQEIAQARQEIARKRAKLEELRQATRRIDDLGLAIDDGKAAIERVEAKLPTEQNIDEVLRQVWEIAREQTLNIKSIKPETRVSTSHYHELPIRVQLTGNFDGFYQFLLSVEQLPRLTRIKDLEMERNDGETGDMAADFVLSVYFEPSGSSSEALAGVNP